MREIKFRAWCDDKKKFVNPTYNNVTLEDLFQINFYKYQQFTGLKDKNGVEIYEGDILSKVSVFELGGNIDYFYVVKWSSSDNGFRVFKYRIDENEDGMYWKKQPSSDSLIMANTYNHVIGNIYEHSELWK